MRGCSAMEINNIIEIVEKTAVEIADGQIQSFCQEYPEINLTEDGKNAVRTRAVSQLTLQLSKFHFKEDVDLKEQFNSWFVQNEREDLMKACKHCLEDEARKTKEGASKNLSTLDSYLKKHLGNIHTID